MTQPPDDNPQPEVEADCDDLPKLTAEEWAYIAQMSPQPDEDDG